MLNARAAPARVLMTADSVGGVWQYSLHLAALLATRNVRVMLAVMGPPPTRAQQEEAAAIEGLQFRTAPFALEWQPQPWAEVDAAGEWLLNLAHEHGADLVHLNGYTHAVLPWEAPIVVVGHSCVCSWWTDVHGTRPPPAWAEYIRRVSVGLRAADHIVAPSMAMANALTQLYELPSPVTVIPNTAADATTATRAKESLVFAAGRVWDPAKNLAALERIASRIAWPIVVAGATDVSTDTRTHARYLGRQPSAVAREWMARAAIYALPARYEPFGLSVLEAAKAGCALVLGDIPSLREHWGGAACFVSADDDRLLAATLQDLIDDADARQYYADRAVSRAKDFRPSQQLAAYLAAYEAAAHTHARLAHQTRSH